MLRRKYRNQLELFISGSLRQLIPCDHVLVRVDRVLDLSWLGQEATDCAAVVNLKRLAAAPFALVTASIAILGVA